MRETAPILRSIAIGWALGAAAGVLLALVDLVRYAEGLDAITTPPPAATLALTSVSLLALVGGLAGALQGLWSSTTAAAVACALPGPRRARCRSVAVDLAAGAGLAAVFLCNSGFALRSRYAPGGLAGAAAAIGGATLLCAGCALCVRGARALLDSVPRVSRLVRGVGCVGALAALVALSVADARVLPRLYPDLHRCMKIAALLCAQLHLALLWHALPSSVARALSRRGAIAVASVGLLALVPVASDHLDSDGNLQFAAMEKLPHVAEGVTWLRVITDFDGDGFSAWFGGGDCANGDPATHPGALDLPDNGRDEDCSGRDATLYRDTAQVGPRIGEVPSGLNVLLVTVDTLRADHLGSYGYPRATSPHIDALAGAGIVYERAYAQASSTERSLPSLLTGRYPSNIPMQLRYRRFPRLDRQLAPTLARAATQTRRLTAAFGQGGILRRFDLDRDFEIKGTQRFNSAEVTEHALGFLASHRRPFLLWLHYADPHEPYRTFEGHDFGQEDIDRYDSSIAHTDALIGRLLEFMSENGLMSSTMIVLTADHGEEFGEHGGRGHASHLYGEVLHVPLIVYFPGAAPTRVPTVVELVDVAPTVLAALGAVSTTPIDGGDLLRPDEDGHAVGEVVDTVVRARSLTLARWKIIQNTARNTIELYDLAVDPTEQRNVAHLQPGVTALLSERLAGAAARAITVDIAAAQDGDAEAQSRLARALPYLTDDTLRREIAAMLRAVDDVSVQFHVYSARQTP